ncbi:hypothetical protein KJ671_01510 [Patescibacteria group bacterium]|nr:hypothetical protein [Patescibacteria group bacterium]
MENIKNISDSYIKTLVKRSKESRIYKPFQDVALTLAEILDDKKNKAIYMRLAKMYDNHELIIKAKDVAERKNIKNKGAYFMKVLKDIRKIEHPEFTHKKKVKKPTKLKLDI